MKHGFLILLLLISFQNLFAHDAAYNKVTNVIISKTASNAKEAKEQAIEEGKMRAFHILLTRLFPKAETLPNSNVDNIEFFISDFELTNEKFSAKTYRAEITVTFNKTIIQKHFSDLKHVFNEENPLYKANESQHYVVCFTTINSLSDWIKIRKVLEEKVKGIDQITPLSITTDMITYELDFSVHPKELAENMLSNHIILIQRNNKLEVKFKQP
jgi:hypothetical protein